MIDIHTRIRTLRKSRGLSQEEVAARMGVSRQAYGNYESVDPSRRSMPTLENLGSLARALGVTVLDILSGDENSLAGQIPIIPWSVIRRSGTIVEQLKSADLQPLIQYFGSHSENAFATVIPDDDFSMYAMSGRFCYPPGTTLVFDTPDVQPVVDGSRVLAELHNAPADNARVFRQFVDDPAGSYLRALNPTYPNVVREGYTVIGVLLFAIIP